MMLKRMYIVALLSVSVAVYASEKSKNTLSPAMQAHNKHYFEVELPKAAFGKDEKKTIGSDLQHGGNYTAIPQNNAQNTQERRFGRGSSGPQDSNAKL